MSRPKTSEAKLLQIRNLIIGCMLNGRTIEFLKGELNQSEVAFIFRLPRNTVSMIKKIHANKRISTK